MAAAQATRYLLSLGHRTVHHLAIPSSNARVGQRAEGWLAGSPGGCRTAGSRTLEAGWSPRSGYLAARTLVADPQVTAVLCGNDELALGVLRAAREAGRDVLGGLSVVSFDDALYAGYSHPALTIRQLKVRHARWRPVKCAGSYRR